MIGRVPVAGVDPAAEKRDDPIDHGDDLVPSWDPQAPAWAEIPLHVGHYKGVPGPDEYPSFRARFHLQLLSASIPAGR